MRLQLATWPEVETYLTTRTDIVVPIGSTEQHGPNGLIGTDAITAEVISWRLGERLGVLVGPTLGVGMAHHHLAFPGTVSFRPSTLMAVVADVVASLTRHGFRRILFVNGHGGNIVTVNAAFQEIAAASSYGQGTAPPVLALTNWWDGPRVKALCAELYGGQDGSHATASEISVTWAAYPDRVQRRDFTPAPARGEWTDAAHFRRLFPDGRIGSNPALSDPDHGHRLIAASVEDLAEIHAAFLAQE
ncbi:MAG: hypothetical protein RLY86_2743 [Pseudomonadota bacterium]